MSSIERSIVQLIIKAPIVRTIERVQSSHGLLGKVGTKMRLGAKERTPQARTLNKAKKLAENNS